jgi:hypothetical protein
MRKQDSKGNWYKIERVGAGAVVSVLNSKTAGYLRRGMLERWRIVLPSLQMTSDEVKNITTNGMNIEEAVELFVKRVEQ